MSYLRAIIASLRIDKLFTTDLLQLGALYLTLAFHIVMIAFIVWLWKWFLFISC